MTAFRSTETRKVEALERIASSLERLADQGDVMQEIAKPRQMHTTPAARVEKIEEGELKPKYIPAILPDDYVEPMNEND